MQYVRDYFQSRQPYQPRIIFQHHTSTLLILFLRLLSVVWEMFQSVSLSMLLLSKPTQLSCINTDPNFSHTKRAPQTNQWGRKNQTLTCEFFEFFSPGTEIKRIGGNKWNKFDDSICLLCPELQWGELLLCLLNRLTPNLPSTWYKIFLFDRN